MWGKIFDNGRSFFKRCAVYCTLTWWKSPPNSQNKINKPFIDSSWTIIHIIFYIYIFCLDIHVLQRILLNNLNFCYYTILIPLLYHYNKRWKYPRQAISCTFNHKKSKIIVTELGEYSWLFRKSFIYRRDWLWAIP